MSVFSPVEVAACVQSEPLVRSALLQWRRSQFRPRAGPDCHFGVFDSFKAARAWLHPTSEFDQAAAAAEYVDPRSRKVFFYDYALMWWLDRSLEDGANTVLDIGGSVGVRRYAEKRNLDAPDALRWRVVEVPYMFLPGRNLAAHNGAANLSFSDLHECVETTSNDIWISADAIHYFEDARPDQLLERCERRPQHILLSGLPLYNGEDFVTIQKTGDKAFVPVHVYNRARFIQDIKALGYTLWDQWAARDHAMDLRGYPERSFSSFTSLYFVDSARMFKRSKPLLSS
jgi:putative methyltransferase (TIGR04325 family)